VTLTPLVCLVLFALWAVALVTLVGFVRVGQVLAGKKRSNEFPSGTPHGTDGYWRLNRAHLNTVENLPIFGALVIAGTLLHVDSRLFHLVPQIVIGARAVQSIAHIASGSARVVNIRFFAFVTQLTCFGVMGVEILRRIS
jgi:uncharacterized MAPEG superfamily protein